jgi:hypothetical protein
MRHMRVGYVQPGYGSGGGGAVSVSGGGVSSSGAGFGSSPSAFCIKAPGMSDNSASVTSISTSASNDRCPRQDGHCSTRCRLSKDVASYVKQQRAHRPRLGISQCSAQVPGVVNGVAPESEVEDSRSSEADEEWRPQVLELAVVAKGSRLVSTVTASHRD